MARTRRRTGKESSPTRHQLLDSVEALLIDSGYASVTYRGVAARAECTSSLVQYYFPTLDDLLVAAVRRRSDQSLEHLKAMLEARPEEPLRVLWEFSNDETDATLTIEFSALGNHRESVRREIVDHTNQLRDIQLGALTTAAETGRGVAGLTPAATLFLLSGIPKMLRLEEGFEVFTGHDDIVGLVEELITEVETRAGQAPG